MTETGRALLIGDFARRCRLPVSTLRYYDKIGLLSPAVIDPSSGYRRYRVDQLSTAMLVARLRAIGTAPGDIAAVLAGGDRAAEVLAAERDRIAGRVVEAQRALVEIDELLVHRRPPSVSHVALVHLTRTRVAAAHFRAAHTDVAPAVLRGVAGLRSALRRAGLRRTGPWGAAFPLEITEQVSGYVFAHLAEPADHLDHGLDTAGLPAGQAARSIHVGGPDTLTMTYHATLQMIEDRGRTPVGPVIEEYLSLDASPQDHPSIRLTVPLSSHPLPGSDANH